MNQLALFELEAPAPQRPDLVARVRAAMGHNFGNFHWWCFNGDPEMCEAVLWQSRGFSREDARQAVAQLAEKDPGLMWPHPTPAGEQ